MSKLKFVPTYEPIYYSKCSQCNKNIYHGTREAEKVKNYREKETHNLHLKVYKCPYNNGYHLTRRTDSLNNEGT